MSSLVRQEQLTLKPFITPDGRRAVGLFLVQRTEEGITARLVSVRFLDVVKHTAVALLEGFSSVVAIPQRFVSNLVKDFPYVQTFYTFTQPTRGPTVL